MGPLHTGVAVIGVVQLDKDEGEVFTACILKQQSVSVVSPVIVFWFVVEVELIHLFDSPVEPSVGEELVQVPVQY